MKTTPWAHQLEGVEFFRSRCAAMFFWGMGAGKSLGTIASISDAGAKRVIIISPKAVVPVWSAEFEKHWPDHPFTIVPLRKGTTKRKASALHSAIADSPAVICAVNYETVWREPLSSLVLRTPWDLVVLDEIQKIKSPGGKASRFAARLGRMVPRRLGLSGTPMPLGPQDLFAEFRFLDPNIFPRTFTAFRARYAIMGGFEGRQIVAWRDMEDINRRLYSIAHRVKVEDVMDLPDCVHEERVVEMGREARRVYGELERDFMADVDSGIITAANALTKLLRLQQVTAGCVNTEDGIPHALPDAGKEAALVEVLGEIENDEPVVVFCRFRPSLDAVQRAATSTGRPFNELSGRVNDVGAVWKPQPGAVVAVQWQSGGMGVDFTASRYCVIHDYTFSHGDTEQGYARLVRHGQERSVVFLHLVAESTVDRHILRALHRKASIIDALVEAHRTAVGMEQ